MAKHMFDAISKNFIKSPNPSGSSYIKNPLPRNTKKTATTSSADSKAILIGNGNDYEPNDNGNTDGAGIGTAEDNDEELYCFRPGEDPKTTEVMFDLLKNKFDPKKAREARRLRHESTDTDGDGSDSSSSLERMEAPDGGWGWVVVFAAFLINMVSDGVTFSFGIFYVKFYNHFKKDYQSKSPTAWIGSLLASMPLLSGPIASCLTDRFGCRYVTIAGSLMAALGFLLASFADSLPVVYLTFGVLTGFGLSLCYVAAVVIVAYYFERRRSLATGLSVCGGGIGTFLFAPFTQYLMDYYDNWWQPTRVLAGAFLALSVCGMLMKDLEWTKKQRHNKSMNQCPEIESEEVSSGLKSERLFSSALCIPTFVQEQDKETHAISISHSFDYDSKSVGSTAQTRNNSLVIASAANNENDCTIPNISSANKSPNKHDLEGTHPATTTGTGNVYFADTEENSASNNTRTSKPIKSDSFRSTKSFTRYNKNSGNTSVGAGLHRNSLTYRGAVISLKRYRLRPASSCPDIVSVATTEDKTSYEWKQVVANTCKWIKGIYEWQNLSNTRFLLFLFSNFLLYMWYDCPYVYLKDAADQSNYPESSSSKLISIVGLFNMFGNIFLGYIGDKKWTDSILVYGICMVICGITIICLPILMSWNYVCLSLGCALFGLTIAANYSLTSVILVKIVSLDGFSNAYGLLLLVQGVGNLVGPPLGGVIYDLSGAISWAFVAAGTGILLSSIFILAPKLMCIGSVKENVGISSDQIENGLEENLG